MRSSNENFCVCRLFYLRPRAHSCGHTRARAEEPRRPIDLSPLLPATMEYLQRAAVAAKAAAKQAKYQMAGLTEIEIKTLECTNSDPWRAHGKDLAELARATRNREDMYLIMKTLWHRLDGRDDQWRHVYKALTVMEFLVAQGAEDVTRELRDSLRTIERLKDFHYKEPNGKDQGINVREKSKNLVKVRAIGADPVPGPRLAARASPRSLERVAPPPRPTLTDPLPALVARSPTSPAPQRSQQDRADARQGHRQQGQVRRHLRRRLPLRKRPRASHARTIPLGRRLAAILGVSRIQGRLLGPGGGENGGGYAAPAAPAPAPAPRPCGAEMQPSFANSTTPMTAISRMTPRVDDPEGSCRRFNRVGADQPRARRTHRRARAAPGCRRARARKPFRSSCRHAGDGRWVDDGRSFRRDDHRRGGFDSDGPVWGFRGGGDLEGDDDPRWPRRPCLICLTGRSRARARARGQERRYRRRRDGFRDGCDVRD